MWRRIPRRNRPLVRSAGIASLRKTSRQGIYRNDVALTDVAHLAEAISLLVQHPAQVAGDAVEDAKNKIASAAEEAQTQVRAASSEIETNIKRNPLTAVLIAFGIGVALGVITRSRG